MVKSILDYLYKVEKDKKKTAEEKRYTQHLNFVGQAGYSEKKKTYDDARKKMGLAKNDNVTPDEYNRMMGSSGKNAKYGDTGEYARWQAYNDKRKQEIEKSRGKIQGPPTPKKLDTNKQWASRRTEDKNFKKENNSFLDKTWNVAKSVGKKVDKYVEKPVDRFLSKATNTASFGLYDYLNKGTQKALQKKVDSGKGNKYDKTYLSDLKNQTRKAKSTAEKVSDFIGEGVGYVAPTGLAVRGAKAIGMGAKITKDMSKAKKLFQMAKEGATVGAMISAAETPMKHIDKKESWKDTAKRVGTDIGLGAVGDPIVHGLGKVASKLLKKMRKPVTSENLAEVTKQLEEHHVKGGKTVEPTKPVAQGVKQVSPTIETPKVNEPNVKTNRQESVDEILKALEQERGKVPQKENVDPTKFKDFDKYLEQAKSDIHNREMVQGYRDAVADKPKSIDEMVAEIQANRDPKSTEHYQERYKTLKNYVEEKYKGQNVNDDIINEAWSHIANRDEDFNVNELVDRAFPKETVNPKANVTEEMGQQFRKNQAEFGQDDMPLNPPRQMRNTAEGTAKNELYKIQRRMAENQIQGRLGRQWADRLGVKQPVDAPVPQKAAVQKREYTPQEIQMAKRLGMKLPTQQAEVSETVAKATRKGKAKVEPTAKGGKIQETATGKIDLTQHIEPRGLSSADHRSIKERIMKEYGLSDQEASKVYFEMMDESRAPKKKENEVMKIESGGAPTLARVEPTQPQATPTQLQAVPEPTPISEEDAQQLVRNQITTPVAEEQPKRLRHKIYKALVDRRATMGLTDKLAGRSKLKSDSALAQAHLESGVGGRSHQQLEDGFYDRNGKKTGESYVDTFKGLKDVDETMAYMTSKRIMDYENRVGKLLRDANGEVVLDANGNPFYEKDPLTAINSQGFSQKEISEKASAKWEREQPHLVKEAEKVNEFMDNQLDVLRDAGFYNDNMIAEMKEDNPNFLPFNRDRTDLGENYFKNTGTGASANRPIHARTGSMRKILDPKNTILKRTIVYNDLAAKNKTRVALLENAQNMGEDNPFIRVVGKDENYLYRGKQKVDDKEVEQDFASHVDDILQGSDDDIAEGVNNIFGKKEGDKNIVYAYKNGDRYHLQVMDKDLADTIINRPTDKLEQMLGIFAKGLTAPTEALRWGVTISPDFAVRNWGRDQLTTYLTSPVGYKPVVDSIIGATHIVRNKLATSNSQFLKAFGKESPLIHAYIRNGGDMKVLSQLGDVDVPAEYDKLMRTPGVRTAMKEIADQPNLLLKAKQTSKVLGTPVKKIFDLLSSASELSEMSTRIGHMRRAVKYGEKQYGKNLKKVAKGKMSLEDAEKSRLDMQDATYIAKAALDFTRGGSVGKEINKIVPFFNPFVQGIDVLGRSMKQNPARFATAATLGITLPSLALHMLNKGEQWYEDIPREDRDMNWYIKHPNWDHPFKFPKPFEPGVLLGSLPERMYDRYMDGDKEAFDGFGKSLFDALSPSMIPQLMKPLLETITGWNFYTGQPIESKVDEYKPVDQRKTVYSSQAAIQMSKIMKRMNPDTKMSPKRIDNLIRGYGGTMTDFINKQGVDRVLRGITKDVPERPNAGIEDVPFASAFTQKNLEGNNQPTNDFYDLADRLQTESKEVAPGKTYKEENARLEANRTMRKMNDKQHEKREIQDDLTMSGTEKQKKIKKLNKEITKLAREGLSTYKKNKEQ